jgi:hypothetical protein
MRKQYVTFIERFEKSIFRAPLKRAVKGKI